MRYLLGRKNVPQGLQNPRTFRFVGASITEGVSLLSPGTDEYTDGDDVRLRNEQLSAKSEAPESLAQG